MRSATKSGCRVLDTFDDFLCYWKAAAGEKMERQIKRYKAKLRDHKQNSRVEEQLAPEE